MKTAFLVDGGFFLSRCFRLKGPQPPQQVARNLLGMCLGHLRKLGRRRHHLYRVFYYDCPPLSKKVHHPVNNVAIDFSKTSVAEWRIGFFEELKRLRKVALRLGYLDEANGHWVIRTKALKTLMRRQISIDELQETDFKYEVRQKGVDMKLGLDIASLTYKRFVDQIVLISGDSDFVSAAKLARREGIDFILDPMWHPIRDDLHEHIDGLQTVFARPHPASPPPQTRG